MLPGMENSGRLLGCALNLSEGRRADVVDLAAAQAATAAAVLDVSSDPDHNRTVLTLAGPRGELVEAVLRLARVAVDHIDVRTHEGVHPRLGAVDVVPFTPWRSASMTDAVAASRGCSTRLWEELALPVFLYEHAAAAAEARPLPWIRKNAFVRHPPDFGGPSPHPTAGATVVGARNLLVAYNVDLATDDPRPAREIAGDVRQAFAGRVRALGLFLPTREAAQVSMNILDPGRTTLAEVFAFVTERAGGLGVAVLRSEVVGLVPEACLAGADQASLAMARAPKILEEALNRFR